MSKLGSDINNVNISKMQNAAPVRWLPFHVTLENSFAMTANISSGTKSFGFPDVAVRKVRIKRAIVNGSIINAGIPLPYDEFNIQISLIGQNGTYIEGPTFVASNATVVNYRVFHLRQGSADCDILFNVLNTGTFNNIQCIVQGYMTGAFAGYNCNWNLTLEGEYSL
jgi:hypothetical protein